MSRYIDTDALIIGIKENNLGEWYVGRIDGKSEEVIPTDTIYKIIGSAPSINIVRCKECKFWIGHISDDDGFDEGLDECRWRDSEAPDADDFCSYGEREGER